MLHSVFKDWFFTIPFRMQSVLASALRGCDTARKNDHSKTITRGIRACLLNNADPTNAFVGTEFPPDDVTELFLGDIDSYPTHYIAHTMHAAEIIGYKHPDLIVSAWWCSFYKKLVKALHLMPESEDQLDVRLGATEADNEALRNAGRPVPEPVLTKKQKPKRVRRPRQPKPNPTWDAGTGTSHRVSNY